jgi:methionyl-tRNA formyltransferase
MKTAVLIGGTSLLVSCGNALKERGITIKLVVAATDDICSWASSLQIPVAKSIRMFPDDSEDVDYIFSIVNDWILPDSVLRKARCAAINYHDSLLPRYAGVNSTTWAIINGESTHGVTWHKMEVGIDTGAILQQERVTIDSTDTALSLNLKCYLAAMNTFQTLVDLIARDETLPEIQQDFGERSYFGVSHTLRSAGFVDFGEPVHDSERTSRALQFGPTYSNPVGTQKIFVNDHVYIVDSLVAIEEKHGLPFGMISSIEEDGSVLVAANGGFLKLLALRELDGRKFDSAAANFRRGTIMCLPEKAVLESYTHAIESLLKKDKLWASTIDATPTLLQVLGGYVHTDSKSLDEGISVSIDSAALHFCASQYAATPAEAALSLLCLFLSGCNSNQRFHVRVGATEV